MSTKVCDFLIAGGGIAAYSAAKKIRRAKPGAAIVMATRDALPPYDLPPLSKEYLRGAKSQADLLYPSAGIEGVDVMTETEVVGLDVGTRRAELANGQAITFSAALLATGADPIRLPVPGADLPNVFHLRTAADARRSRRRSSRARAAWSSARALSGWK